MILLSIIVPVYNVQEYLPECVDSLLRQKITDYEIILVDDGSCDSSNEICDRYASAYANVRTIHHVSNLGLVESRNTGIKVSYGKYLSFVDADDWVDNEMYINYIKEMESDDEISISVTGTIKEHITGQHDFFYLPHEDIILPSNVALEEMFRRNFFGWELWGKIYRRNVIIQAPVDISFNMGEDLERNFQLWKNVKRVFFSCDKFYHYRSHPESMTQKTNILSRNLWRLFDKIYRSDKTLETIRKLAKKYLVRELIKRILTMFFIDSAMFYQDIQVLYMMLHDLIIDLDIYQCKHGIANNIISCTFDTWYKFFSGEINQMKCMLNDISEQFNCIYIYFVDNDAKYLSYFLKKNYDRYGGVVISHSDNDLILDNKDVIHTAPFNNGVLLLLPVTSKNYVSVNYIAKNLKNVELLKVDLTKFI